LWETSCFVITIHTFASEGEIVYEFAPFYLLKPSQIDHPSIGVFFCLSWRARSAEKAGTLPARFAIVSGSQGVTFLGRARCRHSEKTLPKNKDNWD
jgi:hypothetical protein